MKTASWSCLAVSQCLPDLVARTIGPPEGLIVAIDDTVVKKWGREFFGLGRYVDPTDRNPGATEIGVRSCPAPRLSYGF